MGNLMGEDNTIEDFSSLHVARLLRTNNKREKGFEYKRNYLSYDFVDDIAERDGVKLLGR